MPTSEMRAPFMQHWVAELHGVDRDLLDDAEETKQKLLRVTAQLGLTIWADFAYKFELGVSAFVVIAESHVAMHTWPECLFAHVDIITCSHSTDFEAFHRALLSEFAPEQVNVHSLSY